LQVQGTMTTRTPTFPYSVRIPGTPVPETDDPNSSVVPLYNKPLGVFTLKAKPVVGETFDFLADCEPRVGLPANKCRYDLLASHSLKAPVEYVVSPELLVTPSRICRIVGWGCPTSGMTVKSVKVAVVGRKGPDEYRANTPYAVGNDENGTVSRGSLTQKERELRAQVGYPHRQVAVEVMFQVWGATRNTPKELLLLKVYPADVVPGP